MSVRVYWLDCRKVDPAEARVRALMSDRRKEKLAAMRDEAGRRQSAAAELALAMAMSWENGTPLQPVNWHALPGGKPEVEGGLCISLAHSGDMAICAVCEHPVGVDVEAPRAVPPAMRRKIYSRDERERPDDMLLWTWIAKESYLKLTGEGISRAMSGFLAVEGEITDAGGRRLACVQTVETGMPGYVACVCTENREEIEVVELKW